MEEKGLELSWNDCPKDESCYLYVGDHCVGEIQNEIEFMWIRIQIVEQKFSGCYIMFQGKKYEIDENGNMENRPNNLFTTYTQLLAKYIVTTQISRDKKTKIHIPTSKIININNCPKNDFVEIYDNEDNLICYTNSDVEYNWVRAEIKERKLDGCYVMYKGEKIPIYNHGDLTSYPDGLFDCNISQLFRLL